MLCDGAGCFNLVHEPLPQPHDKNACNEFCKKYEAKIVSRSRQEEELMAFKKSSKSKAAHAKKKKKDQETTDFPL